MISYEDWHSKIEHALQLRTQYWNGDKAWKRFLALYRGDHWRTSRYNSGFLEPDSEFPRDRITVNITGSTVLLAKSFLVNKSPKFIINPRPVLDSTEVQQAVISALLQQETLNYEWKERNMHFQCKEATLDALIIGHGITKDGFVDKKATARNIKKDGDIENRDYIEDESPFVERINPFRFLFDTDHENYRQLDAGNWCAEIFFKSREDVLADGSYDKKVLSKIKDNVYQVETVSLNPGSDSDKQIKRDILYEIWDKKFKKYYIFVKGVDEPVKEQDWPYEYLDGFPYTKLDFIPLPNEHYGIGIPYFIEDQQLELNRVRTTMFDHRRRFNRKYTVLENGIDEPEIVKLITGETGTIIRVKQQNAVKPLEEGTIPHDAFTVEGVIKSDINELSGVDKLARGGDLPGRTSASEIQARQNYTNLKLDDRAADVDYFYNKNGRKTLQHIKENYTKDRVIKITGMKGAYWVKYSPSDIKAEFDCEMETISAPTVDEVADRQQRLQIFQLIMQNVQMIMQMKIEFNWQELFKWLFEAFGEKDISRFFNAASPSSGLQQTELGTPNTALNLQNSSQPQTPQMMTPDQLRAGLSGGLNGGQGLIQ